MKKKSKLLHVVSIIIIVFGALAVICSLFSILMRDMMEMGSRRRVVCQVSRENSGALEFFRRVGFVPLEDAPQDPDREWLVYRLHPRDPQAARPIKPYLVENDDYENARECAAALVKLEGI